MDNRWLSEGPSGRCSMSAASAIRKQCLHCVGDIPGEVRKCTGIPGPDGTGGCPLWPSRMGRGQDLSKGHPKLSRLKAIRAFCLACMGRSTKEVRECDSKYCFVVEYRMGKRPKRGEKPRTGGAIPLLETRTLPPEGSGSTPVPSIGPCVETPRVFDIEPKEPSDRLNSSEEAA